MIKSKLIEAIQKTNIASNDQVVKSKHFEITVKALLKIQKGE